MNKISITVLFLSLALSACSLRESTSPTKVVNTQTILFDCKMNQPQVLKTATLLPFEDSQVITYEMLVEKKLFKHLRNVEITVLGSNNNSRSFIYSSEQLKRFTQVSLKNLPIVNADIVDKSNSKKYTEQSLMFFRLGIEETSFSPTSITHTFNLATPCQPMQYSVQLSSLLPLILSSPVKGEGWNALNEGTSQYLAHRRSVFIDKSETLYIPQHYAIDFSRSRLEWMYYPRIVLSALFSNSLDKTYDADVFAVADGVVVAVINNLPEKKPLRTQNIEKPSLKSLTGNYIIYKMDNGKFAFYGHLQPNSIKVKVGDNIVKDQLIALVGNSGNSIAPHLHFSVNETAEKLQSEGIPFVFDNFTTQAKDYSHKRQKPSSTVTFK